ncbi:MAG: serine hydrolase domain-containing protein [Isosphaerales bacterium]
MINRRDVFRAVAAEGLAFWSGPAFGQSQPQGTDEQDTADGQPMVQADERVNQVLAPVRDEHHLPGLIGAILTGHKLAAIGALGIRKIGSPELIRVTDEVHLGSCTKAMTATVIGMLVEEGKLAWGSTIRDVFPDVAAKLDPQFQGATLSHLLTHRAGLPHDGPWWQLPGRTTTQKRRALLTTMLKNAPANRPGSTYAYSNAGYVLAGLMAEQVSGESWEMLMRRRLFEPLGMASAGFGSPGRPGKVNQPWGHHLVRDRVEPTQQDNAPAMGPAGTVHCSVPDWAKFAALHLEGKQGKAKLLKPSTIRALHTPPPGQQYAGGWFVFEASWARGLALNHKGSNTSWYVSIWLAPVANFAILVATNQGGKPAETACDQAFTELIKALPYLTQPKRRRR